MQENRTKIIFIVIFILIAGYYLSFSVRYWLEQQYIDSLPKEERKEYMEENRQRLQQLGQQTLNLGLDLKGGMHVTLEVGTPKLVRELAGENIDSTLNRVIEVAQKQARANNTGFIEEMVQTFNERYPNGRLSRYFRSEGNNITRRSSNQEILNYLQKQRDKAVERAIDIIRNRVNRYGVTEPAIFRQGARRIVVELPGVSNEERVRNLLRGTARLQFRLMADPQELSRSRERIMSYLDQQVRDTTAAADTADVTNPLERVLQPNPRNQYVFGYAAGKDTAQVNEILHQPKIQQMLPRNAELLWSAHPIQTNQQTGVKYFELIGVHDEPELTGAVIEDARINFDRTTNQPRVSMTMNSEGARRWARITGSNIGEPIAIVLDGYVQSYPTVQTKISNGRSSISGLRSVKEAEDLVNILLSGALPAPLEIVEERTVGATLGEESIRSGFYSALFGLVAVAIFMIMYYHTGGAIADIALLLNIIFILGILAAFKATLTLPGIAGIVLTIGMAVDANVLIFDRIREEQRTGKTLRAAINAGYSNAMSAIIDANVTTFFIALILFSFGVGPIRGFAITLMAGIASSLFSAIVITRVIVDYLTRDREAEISFG